MMFDTFEKALLRNPIFPLTTLFNQNGETLDLDILAKEFLANKVFLEAVFWSSTTFYKVLLDYSDGKITDEKKKRKVSNTLKKYIIRSATRPTPYGTFAGVSLSSFDTTSQAVFSKRKLRLDISILRKIKTSIETHPEFFSYLNFQINNTLYEVNREYRFLEVNLLVDGKCQITALEKNQILKKLISICKKKPISFDTFYANFSKDFEKQELLDFFNELIQMRLLISEIELGLTERDDLRPIKAFLNKEGVINHKDAVKYLILISKIESYIEKVQNLNLGNFLLEEYREIELLLKKLGILINEEQLFHVDLLHKTSNEKCFSKRDLRNIYESIEIVSKITDENKKMNDLETFRKVFYEKYETQSVPLLEALDIDFGIGFPTSESIGNNVNEFFNFQPSSNKTVRQNETNVAEWLLDRLEVDHKTESIEITKHDLEGFPTRLENLSNTFFVVGQFVEDGKILLQNVGGVNGNTLLSRFSYLEDSIEKFCQDISAFEKNISQNIIIADIIWIENNKVGNISRRISNLDYEIPLLNTSSKKGKYKLDLNDLQVSLQHNEVILTSKKHKKRVIPILTNAHDFQHSLNPIYKFLVALQYQNKKSFEIRFDFKSLKKRYFPEIFYKNIILYPAHWIIQKSDAKQIKTSKLPIEELKEFLSKWNVPKFVLIVQGDNELLIDTHNASFLEILWNEIKQDQILILKEWLTGTGSNGMNFTSQFILPIKKSNPVPVRNIKFYSNTKLSQRTFFPGSDWIYFKIYCSTNFSNTILKEIYKKYILDLKRNNFIEKWFFIRYAEPHHHLRLRVKKVKNNSHHDFYGHLKEKLKSFQKNGVIWKIKTDTYQRELERYGINDINYAEDIFYFDSENYIKDLNRGKFEEIESHIFLAAQNVNFYLSLLKMSFEEKMYFCEKIKKSFAEEKTELFLKEAENKVRNLKSDIFNFLDNDSSLSFQFGNASNILDISNIQHYIHMNVNRWFESNQRDWEYFLYCLLYEYNKQKFYKSK